MNRYVLQFDEIDVNQITTVGGKAASLRELSGIDGVRVPDGFCVTTSAFKRIMTDASLKDDLDALARLDVEDRERVRSLTAEIRSKIERTRILPDVVAAVSEALVRNHDRTSWAVRSSATAEDLPTASFAGLQDSYLNIIGPDAVLRHLSRCWASLFTDRAVTYRIRKGLDHRQVHMAVVVQKLVSPEAAGILFTADPVTGNRKISTIEASFGLGEALVSGVVNADAFKVRDGEIVGRRIATKELVIAPTPEGGTREHQVAPERREQPALTDAQVLRLAELGRRIELHFGLPQDIEWCLFEDDFEIVQSRPITTLFPIPIRNDRENHVYLSVGHQQMMTDPHRPLGISIRQLTAGRPMHEAAGRLFVDVTEALSSPATRAGLLAMAEKSDPLTGDALRTIIDRGDFLPMPPEETSDAAPAAWPVGGRPTLIDPDPAIVAELMARNEASIATLKREISTKSGLELLDFMNADFPELKRLLFHPESQQVLMTGMESAWWLNDHLYAWLGEKNASDTLTLSVPDNITSEMGLALLSVADAIRPHVQVVDFLQRSADEDFLDELPNIPGGPEARDAILAFLEKFGMRCVGEIDITRMRWSERPATLLPIILANIRNFEPGVGERRFEEGRRQAEKKEQELLERLRALPEGWEKAEETKRMIDRLRTFIGYREYPKYGMISRYFVYKQALMAEAERLVRDGVLDEKEDIFYLTLPEIREVVRTRAVAREMIRERQDAFESYQALTPPRVLTSEGEALNGAYKREDFPAGSLLGIGVSAGTVEGRARVVLDMTRANLQPGDILVTPFTDPSWTPIFVGIKGLVTEVGGLMTHGAVIAREYGLPAVVGVKDATHLVRDGQRIRINGLDGHVELLN